MPETTEYPWSESLPAFIGRLSVKTGSLPVPPDVEAKDLATMEEMFRQHLWPRTETGTKRYSREFAWTNGGRILHYRIVDVEIDQAWRKREPV